MMFFFCLFWHQFCFFVRFAIFFFFFAPKWTIFKSEYWKLFWLFNLLLSDFTNSIFIKDTLSIMSIRFIYCVWIFGHIFDCFMYFHIFQYTYTNHRFDDKIWPYSLIFHPQVEEDECSILLLLSIHVVL